MKRLYVYLPILLWILFGYMSKIMSQESTSKATNPFPLTEKKVNKLINQFERITEGLRNQYPDSNLATWPEEQRNAYLKAKASKVVLQFAPDFYRKYDITITRRLLDRYDKPANSPSYRVIFHYDMKKERLDGKGIAINVDIWEDNGQASGFTIPAHENYGYAFWAPDWEDGLYKRMKEGYGHPYTYRTLPVVKKKF